ncbi:TetR/AcrR family transcriptional regulator [Microbacterium sp.]|uniref:TetR/AcrR family transcriptional regulator n=1 Tax=Microbacterium sp. TaxID=51671 RepID=UPI0039E5F08D
MSRPTRSDARRNAELLRVAALRVFMSRGIDAPLDDVAREAGVSIGTLYNHFGNRDRLIDDILPGAAAAQLARIRIAAETTDDPRERVERYLHEVFAVQASDRLLSDALATLPSLPADAARTCQEVIGLGRRLIADARDHGASPLLDEDTLVALILANSTVQRGGSPKDWDRLLITLARA